MPKMVIGIVPPRNVSAVLLFVSLVASHDTNRIAFVGFCGKKTSAVLVVVVALRVTYPSFMAAPKTQQTVSGRTKQRSFFIFSFFFSDLRLGSGGFQGAGGLDVHIIKVDFFDEADGELVIDEKDLVGSVDPRAEVLAHPPVTQVSEHGDARIRIGYAYGVGGQDFGPDY